MRGVVLLGLQGDASSVAGVRRRHVRRNGAVRAAGTEAIDPGQSRADATVVADQVDVRLPDVALQITPMGNAEHGRRGPEGREQVAHAVGLLRVVGQIQVELGDVQRQSRRHEALQVGLQHREFGEALVEMRLLRHAVDQPAVFEDLDDLQIIGGRAGGRQNRKIVEQQFRVREVAARHVERIHYPVPTGDARATERCGVGRRCVQGLVHDVDQIDVRVARRDRAHPLVDFGKLLVRGQARDPGGLL